MPLSGLPFCDCGQHRYKGWIMLEDLSDMYIDSKIWRKRIRCVKCKKERITNAANVSSDQFVNSDELDFVCCFIKKKKGKKS